MQVRCLNFGDVAPRTGIIGRPRNLEWPVNGYRISLPLTINTVDDLNTFERTILGIMRVSGLQDAASVSKEVCLEKDFVEGVLLRLRDKNFIDEQNRITSEGSNHLNESEGGLELRTAWVFRELVSGRLLPFIYLPRGDNPPSWKKEPAHSKRLAASKMSFGTPTPKEVLSVMSETKRRLAGYGAPMHLPRVGQIDVSPHYERFNLDCPIVMRDTDGRWRIADPFGHGYSRELEDAFLREMDADENLAEWVRNWSNSLVVKSDEDLDGKDPSNGDRLIKNLYPGLFSYLRVERDGTRKIGHIYAAIEWALFYSCRLQGFEDELAELKFTSPTDQIALLKDAMLKIGCDGSGHVAPVSGPDLKNYLAGTPEMKVVLPMAILQAAEDPSHPLRAFAEQYPDFVARIGRIKGRRDAPMHGGEGERFFTEDAPDVTFMKELVTSLLPEVVFDGSRKPADGSLGETFRNVNFKAENSLIGEFGPATPYLKMSRGAREALLGLERFWITAEDGDNIQPLINDCCSALQAILDAEIVSDGVGRPSSRSFDPCAVAVERCERLELGELTGGVLSARRPFIQDAAQGGGNHTLGPSLIVYLALADEEKLSSIESSVPGFVPEICKLTRRRGHGNGIVRGTREEAGNIRNFTFDFVRAVLEV